MEYYPRKIEEKLNKWLNREEIILMKGPRQSGKTTIFLHLKEKLDGDYVTLEDEDMLNSFETNPKQFAKRYLKNKKNYLFIDEAQYCKKAGKNLKLLFDLYKENLKLCVTGSGSFDIKVEIGKYLVGRAIYFELFPLDFENFLLWMAEDLHKTFLDYKKTFNDFITNKKEITEKPVFTQEFTTLLEEYLLYGGFPAIVKEKNKNIKKELLKNLTRTYMEKDIFFFFNLRHIEKFKKLLNYLSFNNGSMMEISSITNDVKIDYKTAENYLSILSNTYIINLISPYHKNLTTELKKTKKIYFEDTGIRNSILNNFLPMDNRTDKGILMENFILNELKRDVNAEIKYWRTTGKAEVDFILQTKNELIPVEVKNKAKPGKSFFSFIKNYEPEKAIVFTEKNFGIEKFGKTKIAYLPHYYI
jgi:uncharacterized protein